MEDCVWLTADYPCDFPNPNKESSAVLPDMLRVRVTVAVCYKPIFILFVYIILYTNILPWLEPDHDYFHCWTSHIPQYLTAWTATFMDYYNQRRYHKSLANVIPADAYLGPAAEILEQQVEIKRKIFKRFLTEGRTSIERPLPPGKPCPN
jgi:hypothetical protein